MTAAPPSPRSGRPAIPKGQANLPIYWCAHAASRMRRNRRVCPWRSGRRRIRQRTGGCTDPFAPRLLLIEVFRVELLFPEEPKCRAVIVVCTGLRNHVDGRAFGASIGRRETLRANHEFLNRLEGK